MSNVSKDTLTDYLRRLTLELHKTEARLREAEAKSHEPIAIVGMALRMPCEVVDLDGFWRFLEQGRDAVAPIPASRWDADAIYDPDPDTKGKSYVRSAALLDGVDLFDAPFFGISPREARRVDPQHRLLLETAWGALEDAGILPGSLKDSTTGVFIGAGPSDYAFLRGSVEEVEAYDFMGTLSSFAAGRLAFSLGLQGPAIAVDTACSSALVALHLACKALRNGECDLALAGGGSVMAVPETFIVLSRTRALAPDGRSKTFSANADGYGRGEGVVVLALERLADARARGRRILAVVRGSAINHDGASSGITVPNGVAQQKVIRAALKDAGVGPTDVDVVECHGTGTALGDPIEVHALAAVYGEGRAPSDPVLVGAVKTNIGHLECASGLAGIAKMVASLQHGAIPATLHTSPPNPHIDWDGLAVRVVDSNRPWARRSDGGPRRAGVSAIGLSGTNAHVILEEAPSVEPDATPAAAPLPPPPALPILLSAKTEGALRAQAAHLAAHLAAHPELRLVDVAYSLATTRSHFDHRAGIAARDRQDLLGALEALSHGRTAPNVAVGHGGVEGKLAFVFPGQGSQWVGMALPLLETSSVFRERYEACERALAPHIDWSVTAALRGGEGAPSLDRVDVVQPLLFAVMVSLASLWRSAGIEPDAVVGHSQGEIAAACVAGALSLEDAARVVALRSRAITKIAGRGGMAAVELGASAMQLRLERFGDRLSIAAINSHHATLVAGEPEALDALLAELGAAKIFARRVRVDYASHSAQIEAIRDELADELRGIAPRASAIPLYSTVTGEKLDGAALDAAYWYRNLRQTVRFADATACLLSDGHGFFVEVSPHPVLALALHEATEGARSTEVGVVGSLRRDEGDFARFLLSLIELHTQGRRVDWGAFFAPSLPRRVALPTYAFQRERYWLEAPTPRAEGATPASDEEEARFWGAVERGDVDALTEALRAVDLAQRSALASVLPMLSTWRRQRHEQSAIDSWRYRIVWKPLPSSPSASDASGTWVLAIPARAGADELASRLTRGLTARGAAVVELRVTPEGAERALLAARLRDEAAARGPLRGVISLLALDEAPSAEYPAIPFGLVGALALAQALGDADVEAPLWLITRGAVSTGRSDRLTRPAQAMAWGLGRSVALERPESWGGLLDVGDALDDKAIDRLVGAIAGGGDEDQLALRATGIFARRLVRARLAGAAPSRAFAPRGTVLVTGGTTGVGAQTARWLARIGAKHLLLASRRGPSAPLADELRAELAALGAEVTLAACDVADRGALGALLASIPPERPLTAVFHSAGAIDDGALGSLTPERLGTVLRPKVEAARHLDELTRGLALDAFVLFSSASGVLGNAGQANYGAANAFLDALAEHRRALGLPATAVAWGAWASGGLLTDDVAAELRRRGLAPMAPALACAALQQALEHDDAQVTIADIDWKRIASTLGAARSRPLLRELPDVRRALDERAAASGSGVQDTDLLARLRPLSEGERLGLLSSLVLAETAAVLGHGDPAGIDPQRGFFDLGLDSLMAVELRRRLQHATHVKLPATITFDHPSPRHVAAYLRGALAPAMGEASPLVTPEGPSSHAASSPSDEPIAIVGMALRLPGGADDPESLWHLLEKGVDTVGPIPESRWDAAALFDPDPDAKGKCNVRDAALLDRVDLFDAAFFGISPREAVHVDPTHRLLLETAWHALEDARIVPASLKDSRTGVFVGTGASEYFLMQTKTADADAHSTLGASSFASGRLAFTLGLQGPAFSVDTACSSSLVALHLACQSLRSGECDVALAAGASLIISPDVFVLLARTRVLAPDGRSKAFSANADGFGRGEGAVVLALERLSDARARGRKILAVIRGTAVNHDGASSGITAPNGTSQQKVIRAALDNARLAPAAIDVAECHGTGTVLGDPIEVQALAAVYGEGRPADRPLLVGALKTNIGHLESASGLAGLAKVVASLRHEALPATLHTHPRNPHIAWQELPLDVVDSLRPWPRRLDGSPRRAAVSAFGLSGTNAHVIVEEATSDAPAERPPHPSLPVPVLLSARSEPALRAQADRLRSHLLAHPDLHLGDVAASLATARSHFEHRAAVVADGAHGLLDALDALAHGRSPAHAVTAHSSGNPRLALLFTGQGSQRPAMGRSLYDAYPAFRDALDAVCALLDRELERPLAHVLFAAEGSEQAALLDQTSFTQPALFALEVALFRLVETWGVKPDLLLGHSIGELVAAHVAGVLSLEDACTLVAARSRLMQALPLGGAMVTVEAAEPEVLAALHRTAGVEIAALNGPTSTVLSGELDAVLSAAALFQSLGRKTSRLRVSHAFHSAHMHAMLEPFGRIAERLTFHPPRIPIVSNLTGKLASAEQLCSPDYWVRHVRHAVRFLDGIRTLEDQGVSTFLELGPHGVLSALGQSALSSAHDASAAFLPALRKDRPEVPTLLTALGSLHARGHLVDWARFFEPLAPRHVDLPTYPFQRERFWVKASEARDAGAPTGASEDVQFWRAVESGDVDSLSGALHIDDEANRSALEQLLPALSTWRRSRKDHTTVDAWRYRIAWKPLASASHGEVAGPWLLVVPAGVEEGDLARSIARALTERGGDLVEVRVAREAIGRARIAEQLAASLPEGAPLRGVLSLLALDEAPLREHPALPAGLAATLALMQALGDAGIGAPLWMITRGAISIGRSDRITHPLQAMTWGLGRVLGLEHPQRWGGLVDLADTPLDARSLERLAAALGGTDDEDQIALRPTGLYGRRLLRAPLGETRPTEPFAPRGTILVTGGTGAIGAHVARWLAARGAERLVLTSRRGGDAPGADALRAELEALGARVTLAACDAADRQAVAALLRELDVQGTPVRAVFHASGVARQAPIEATTLADLAEVVTGKVSGAQHLHELLADRPLDAFILFSSGAAAWGSGHQGGYAAANAFLDAIAEQRRHAGQAATSIAWGAWAGAGMLAEHADAELHLRRRGLSPMAPSLAIVALGQALDHHETLLVVADIDWATFAPAFAASRRRPLLRDLLDATRALEALAVAPEPGAQERPLLARLRPLSADERLRHVVSVVLTETASVLGHPDASRIEPARGFFDLGLDSLVAVELRRHLELVTGLKLPATVTFDHPSPQQLAAFLCDALTRTLGQATGGGADDARGAHVAAAAADEPIAIVGMALRLPGHVGDRDALWELLRSEVDAVGPIPKSRWDADALYDPDPDAKGKSYVREAALAEGVDLFDASFFGISPREAKHLDPQHRLLLETSWQALEDARIVPASLKDSSTGVFVGIGGSEYGFLEPGIEEADAYSSMGAVASFAAGRLAFTLGLQGPALAVDTACSSSLVALHLACQSLRSRECNLALAMGVHVMAAGEILVVLSRTRAVAPDGRSKTFSANADGYGRGEGAVVLALERLSDARARGRKILAVIRGTAVNHDGASSGITAPNGTSQQKVIRAALDNARLAPAAIDVAECHGTGTVLGDPIEVQALAAVYGEGRPADRPLLVGALKTNIGHLESASGLAGLAKVVASLRHEALPATLHTHPRNPHIAWQELPLDVVDSLRPWPRRLDGSPRRAAVSAFGLSGTNAHVIVEEAPSDAPAERPPHPSLPVPVLLSARSEPALRAQADRLRSHLLAHPDLHLGDVAASLATARSHFEHRAAVVADGAHGLLDALDALAHGRSPAHAVTAHSSGNPRLALLFTGQGSQRPAMGRSLYDAYPAFRDALDAVCALLDRELERPLAHVLFAAEGSEQAALLDQTSFTQPALFALEVALFRLVETWGVKPDLLLGHSIGELVAAHVAGVLSLEDACTLVAARSRLMQALPLGGAMVTVEAAEPEVLAALHRTAGVEIAALNGPTSTVLSGELDAVLSAAALFQSLGRKTSRLRVSHAFHSAHMHAMLEPFGRIAERLTFHPPRIPIVSNLTGKLASAEQLCSPDYWVRHVRHAVRFLDGIRTLEDQGVSTFLELGPHGVLSALGQSALSSAHDASAAFLPALRKDRPEVPTLLTALGSLHARGHLVDWARFFEPLAPRHVDLPTYPFQRERFWLDAPKSSTTSAGTRAGRYPLAGQRLDLPDGSVLHLLGIGPGVQPYLADHAVYGRIVVPGAFYVAVLLAVAASHWPDQPLELRDVQFARALTFDEPSSRVTAHLQLTPLEGASPAFAVTIATQVDDAWVTHATGTIAPLRPSELPALAAMKPRAPEHSLDAQARFLDDLQAIYVDWGPQWRWLRQIRHVGGRTGVGYMEAPAGVPLDDAPIPGGLLDNAFGVGIATAELPTRDARESPQDKVSPLLPFAVERIVWPGNASTASWAEYVMRDEIQAEADGSIGDITLYDPAGAPVARIEGLSSRRALAERFLPDHAARDLYAVQWIEQTTPSRTSNETWALLGPEAAGLEPALRSSGQRPEAYADIESLRRALDRGVKVPEVVVLAHAPSAPPASSVERAGAAHEAAVRALAALQAWLSDERFASSRLVVTTERAIATRPDEDVPNLDHAAIWGLVRATQTENPDRPIVLVDLDPRDGSRRALSAALHAGEHQVALRDGRTLAPRLTRLPPASEANDDGVLDPEGTVLVTGGTGTLGGLVARHLVKKHGARHLLLASRKGLASAGASDLQRELESAGASVTIAACDVSDRRALEALLSSIPERHRLTAVVHAAGTLDDGVLGALTADRLRAVLRSKIDGALHLHELTLALGVRAFALFSSLSGVLGGAGQANYAAANAFLDALAHHRKSRGLSAVSIDWGPWTERSGMTSQMTEADRRRIARVGMLTLSSEEGLALLDAALRRPEPALAAARIDVTALRAHALPTMLHGLVRGRTAQPTAASSSAASSRKQHLLSLSPEARDRALLDLVRGEVATVLGITSPSSVDNQRPIQELGLDSLMAVELRNRLAAAAGVRLPATLLFDHPTVSALGDYLHRQLGDTNGVASTPTRSDREIRDALAKVPLARLRDAGLLDALLRLADAEVEAISAVEEVDADAIAEMGVGDLIRLALDGAADAGAPGGSDGELYE
ncbi:SDR family NAD(P)-dependent oxidoreductase [Sorangium sp. So ce448]|uniref:type I polyketide synthase n=1 Tax=Sorangium sp. So ce448 TaxID=3133314 RepID=UPI003F5E4485